MALTDIFAKPRVCELGKIKIGRKGAEKTSSSGNTYRAPEKLDHFEITTLQRDDHEDFVLDHELMASLDYLAESDGKLRQLPVAVLSNDLDEILQASWQWYKGKRMAAVSDGVTLTRFFDRDKNAWMKEPVQIPWENRFALLTEKVGKNDVLMFKLHTTLNVVIAAKEARWGGVYKFRTTSRITADQLYGSLMHIQELTGGVLRGLPLRMVLRPVKVSPDGKTTTVYVVHIELRGPDLGQIQHQALERARFEIEHRKQVQQARLEYKALLTAPGAEPPEEQTDIAEEFHPEPAEEPPSPQELTPDPLLAQAGIETPPAEPASPEFLAKVKSLLDAYQFGSEGEEFDELLDKLSIPRNEIGELTGDHIRTLFAYLEKDPTTD